MFIKTTINVICESNVMLPVLVFKDVHKVPHRFVILLQIWLASRSRRSKVWHSKMPTFAEATAGSLLRRLVAQTRFELVTPRSSGECSTN